MVYYARKTDGRKQLLKEHLLNVAKICGNEFKTAPEVGYASGLYHDDGKYKKDFQDKLDGKVIMVDHSSSGAKIAFEGIDKKNPYNTLTLQMVAYAIAGHHAGLPDGGFLTSCDDGTLIARLKSAEIASHPTEIEYPDLTKLSVHFAQLNFQNFAMGTRMLLSCLAEGDYSDAERFEKGIESKILSCTATGKELFKKFKVLLDDKIKTFGKDGAVNTARENLRQQLLAKTDSSESIFGINMPTGSGKTLASMAFAIDRAIKKGKKRIIYVIPYTSITQQTAELFKNIFGKDNVLEHHSAVINDLPQKTEEKGEDGLHIENWQAPIIVTTDVQFFESLYAAKASKLRKIHNIADSIICLDEVQTIPIKLFYPCFSALSVLAKDFGCDVVMMSATLPDFQKHIGGKIDYLVKDLIDDKRPYEAFKRCQICCIGKISAEKLLDGLDTDKSNLIIVNSKAAAITLYNGFAGTQKYGLTTFLTPIDRKNQIEEIRQNLKDNKNITVFSTSLVEAGVDFDFDFVYREIAGLDSIMQSAGRCNRNGKKTGSITYVFEFEEKFAAAAETEVRKAISAGLITTGKELDNLDTVDEYFNQLYSLRKSEKDEMNFIDQIKTIKFSGVLFVSVPFRQYAEKFCYIDSPTKDVVIVTDQNSAELIRNAENKVTRAITRGLQMYTVALYPNIFNALYKKGHIKNTANGIFYIDDSDMYSHYTGLNVPLKDKDSKQFYNF